MALYSYSFVCLAPRSMKDIVAVFTLDNHKYVMINYYQQQKKKHARLLSMLTKRECLIISGFGCIHVEHSVINLLMIVY